jgi:hypothetical protein
MTDGFAVWSHTRKEVARSRNNYDKKWPRYQRSPMLFNPIEEVL